MVAGFIITAASALSIIQDAEENTFFMALLDVNPLEEQSTSFRISNTSQPFYVVVSRVGENQLTPPAVLVEGRLVDPDGETILSDRDIIRGFTKVEPTVAGTYRLYLTNTHSTEGVRLLVELTHGPIPTSGTETLSVAGEAVAGVSVMLASAFVITAGAALFFRERRKSKKTLQS